MMKRNRLLLRASTIQMLLFVILAKWVHTHPVNRFDITMTRGTQKRHNPMFTALSQCCTLLCSWQFVNLLAFPLALVLWRCRLRLEAVIFASTTVCGTALRKLLQNGVARPRPFPPLAHVTKKKKASVFPAGMLLHPFLFTTV